ncbi:CDP-alcohol phosphatidyltransferase family protein [Alkaliphilus pronyensis]|uniref:Phosphatidylglycerophosphate synthase n=1 Tax=Alkaliphilus pronyensis TaxID=1482732 RepID=A0A6I0FBI0_9FIRM|nr:CDP-alcohol phosphatidyltransferase family protein [Alkaliphilus pronyensis]KAB3529507.1 CDP-alcohol phosphatidyltransferase family protein [Alkaliphilus pronyensis]
MKTIPNYLSFTRIIFSLILIFVKPLSVTFYTIYIICGLSDIMDGFIARRIGITSKFGARLDSLADLIMVGILVMILYPIVKLTDEILIWIIFIAIIRVTSIVVALKKYRTFAIIHTYGNKVTGIVLFISVTLLPYINTIVLMYIISVVASISSIEELIIQLTSNELELNKRSIFLK